MSVRNSILRSIRLQVKSGFLKSEPYAYKFMKRYPPISNDSTISAINISNNSINNKRNSSYGTIDVSKIPYMYLYDKILSDNPIYNDEKVFPGYWQQEPQALVLAKKQYEYIHMNGLSEQEAYEKAIDYINTIENNSYLQLKEFYNILNSNDSTNSTTNNNGEAKRENGTTQENSTNSSNEIKLPFVLDNEIMNELQKWKDILSMKSYDELELADQGELDYFIQTKILKWSEIERERRMKDVLFVKQYNNLLTKLLPIPSIDSYDSTTKTGSNNTNKFKETFYALNKIDQNKLTTNLPFYINDYLHFYPKVLSETNLRKWSAIDRNNFSKWIIDTLALREILDKNSNSVVQKYLDEVRAHFFPMLRYNNMQNSTNGYSIYLNKLPSLNEIRELLYQNDIGYKKLNNKVYVKRYYRLPMLLFPREVLTFRIASDPDLLSAALGEDNNILLEEIKNAGLDASLFESIKAELSLFQSKQQADAEHQSSTSSTLDMSMLDALLKDNGSPSTTNVEDESDAGASDDVSDGSESSDSGDSSSISTLSPDEWEKLVKLYHADPKTELEMDRFNHMSPMDREVFETAVTEDDLKLYHDQRLESELIMRARMARRYQLKEAARRTRDWQRRDVWITKLPNPAAPLL